MKVILDRKENRMPRARNRIGIMQTARDQMKKENKDVQELDSGSDQETGSTTQTAWSASEEEDTIKRAKQSSEIQRQIRPTSPPSEDVKRTVKKGKENG